jgi:DNA-binding transcriptional regulator GbsR (MarR family)
MADNNLTEARNRLIEAGGKFSQDLGMGRIVGQMLLFLYFLPDEGSLDDIGEELGLSKASVSIAARQLESFGLVRRVWKKGDRKRYYRTTENIGLALQQGVLTFLKQKMLSFSTELDHAMEILQNGNSSNSNTKEVEFCKGRINRALQLQKRFEKIVSNPLVNLFLPKQKIKEKN